MSIFDIFKSNTTNTAAAKPGEKKTDIVNYSFHVAGVTFHDDNLKKAINKLVKEGKLKEFNGLSDKEIMDDYESLSIFENQTIDGVKLEKYKYKNEDAIKVLIKVLDDYVEVGSVPREELPKVLDIIDNPNNKINFIAYEIVGGLTKGMHIEWYGEDPTLNEEELNYGVQIYINYVKSE